ncbi:MAG TPA: FlgD immunoglobulin-like domain containing protein, partial [Candidatus Eisenbacteria bacterium]
LCNNGSFDANPVIALDGTGGAIVSFRNGSGGVDAVRVNSGGQIPVTGVGPLASELAPPRAWPNPFRDQVSIAFSLTAPAPVRLEVFDVAGRRVWASPARPLESGRHTLVWNGRTEAGTSARGGIYFLRARGPQVAVSRTVVCVK